jgi:SAM-dependent methyltransferase
MIQALVERLGRLRSRILGLGPPDDLGLYAARYEWHALRSSRAKAVGGADFDLVGALELGLLRQEGLAPGHALLDLGCGVGRLARHVVPALGEGGRYVGADISRLMLRDARRVIDEAAHDAACAVELVHQRRHRLPLADASFDYVCAFSVFTHVEHEDALGQLRDAHRVTRSGGRMLFSCLPIELAGARDIFLQSARHNVRARWRVGPRNVVTTRPMMEWLAEEAGWKVLRWYDGETANIEHPGTGVVHALGQSTCVLEKT